MVKLGRRVLPPAVFAVLVAAAGAGFCCCHYCAPCCRCRVPRLTPPGATKCDSGVRAARPGIAATKCDSGVRADARPLAPYPLCVLFC